MTSDAIEPPFSARLFGPPIDTLTSSDDRYTPRWVFDGLGETFDLDPASPVHGGDCVPARRKFTLRDDGLTQPWDGFVWCNPPFSNATPWADRFRAHANGVWLGPVATARWFPDLAAAADRLWLCRDFPFTHHAYEGPLARHPGKRSSMPLAFVSIGERGTAALARLARCSGHPGVLVAKVDP